MISARHWLLGAGLALTLPCCKKAEGVPTAGSATAAASAASAAAPAAPAEQAKATVNGKSLSQASMTDVETALKKQGYAYKSGGAMKMGSTETVTVRGAKGNQEVKVSIVRPSSQADTGTSMKMLKASEQGASFAKDGATYLEKDAEVLVAVVIEGKKDEAKKILDTLVVR
ncbi:MAG: hypothetical protein IT377_01605 [Polyangiaceae bacterium]|nr:hypothetical protein [Polyangiaceae bacterium]